jgi:transposase-like protein
MGNHHRGADVTRSARRDQQESCRQLVTLFQSGPNISNVARELGCPQQLIRQLIKAVSRIEGGVVRGLNARERAELLRLRRQNRQLRNARRALLKASAEMKSVPRPGHALSRKARTNPRAEDDLSVWLRGLT